MSIQPTEKNDNKTVNLLWTGGWDSTYRLLYLLLIKKLAVNIHYILDHHRRSRFIEMETMIKIQEKIINSYPGTESLFKKMVFTLRNSIPEDEEVTKKWSNLKENKELGDQYKWLARYGKIHRTKNLEICIQGEEFAGRFKGLFRGHIQLNSNECSYQFWELVDVDPEEDISIFVPFRFPIWRTPKLQMKKMAEEFGFLDILEMSWWCHKPVRGKPCGVCKPCKHYIEDGMEFRFPRSALLRNKILYDPLPREIRYFFQHIHRTLKKKSNHASSQSDDKKEIS